MQLVLMAGINFGAFLRVEKLNRVIHIRLIISSDVPAKAGIKLTPRV